MTRTCVCFLAHCFDAAVRMRFDKLARDCAGTSEVYLIAPRGIPVPDEYLQRSHAVDFAVLRQRARAVIGDSIAPGNCHLRMLSAFEAFPGYDRYWFVEYDVSYNGDWGDFFADFDDEPADLLATHVRAAEIDPRWYWSETFDPGPEQIAEEERRIAFLPIARMSARALHATSRAVERGWTGHFEMLVPTAVERAGLTISDIGGSSRWTPAHRRQRHYLTAGNVWETPPLATVRFRPIFFRILPRLRNTLYHPDKGERVPFAEALLALRLFKEALVGHPRKAVRYGRLLAARFVAQWYRRNRRAATLTATGDGQKTRSSAES